MTRLDLRFLNGEFMHWGTMEHDKTSFNFLQVDEDETALLPSVLGRGGDAGTILNGFVSQ